MGFTTGLLGGFTLTTTLLYLSLSIHTRNRVHQASLLSRQSLLLNQTVEPLPQLQPALSREVQAGLWETAKDRWNKELESNVKKLQETDWAAVGERMEEGVSRVWRQAFQKTREAVPDPPPPAGK